MTKTDALDLLEKRIALTDRNFRNQIKAGSVIPKHKITDRVNFYKGYITALAETKIVTLDEYTELIENINALEMYWNERRLENL